MGRSIRVLMISSMILLSGCPKMDMDTPVGRYCQPAIESCTPKIDLSTIDLSSVGSSPDLRQPVDLYAGPDLALDPDLSAGASGFRSVYMNMDSPGFQCTNAIAACHGGSSPSGIAKYSPMGLMDMMALLSTYQEVYKDVNLTTPEQSLFLRKLLSTAAGGLSHAGGTYFANTTDPTYQRWLAWIQMGAPFE